jgi:hypothetical protein
MPRITGTRPQVATPKPKPAAPAKPAATGRAKYVTPDQIKTLKQCDAAVAAIVKGLATTHDPLLKGIKAKDVTVDTLGDFPYVTVKKNGKTLFDRQEEVGALYKLLPISLRRGVSIGDVSPY